MQAWNDHSQSNKEKAEMEMARAQKLRELIFHLIEQTTNDLRVQGGARPPCAVSADINQCARAGTAALSF